MRLWALVLFLSLTLVGIIMLGQAGQVQATGWTNNSISITEIGYNLGIALGFSAATAQLIGGIVLGVILLLIVMLPVVFIVRKANAANMYILIVGLAMAGANVAMQLFPWWLLLIMSMFIALMFAGSVRGWITGKTGE